MIYNAGSIHDGSITCACQQCINEKGQTFIRDVPKESFPWTDKGPQFNHITYELKQFQDGFSYVDKNLKVW